MLKFRGSKDALFIVFEVSKAALMTHRTGTTAKARIMFAKTSFTTKLIEGGRFNPWDFRPEKMSHVDSVSFSGLSKEDIRCIFIIM